MIRLMSICGLLLTSVVGCTDSYARRNPGDPDNNLVEYQFIDADTKKPIQGAYVNVVWVSPTPAGKVNGSKCLQAALLRSDANGWVKMDGPKGSIREVPWIMVPGYEEFTYDYKSPNDTQVTHIIREGPSMLDLYPAWVQNLEEMGYTYHTIDHVHYPLNGFYKSYPIEGFVDYFSFPRAPQRYFVTNRSLPGNSYSYIVNVANSCGPGGVNIGLSEAERAETGTRRGLHQLEIICDEGWDTAKGGYPDQALAQALWLVEAPMENEKAWERMRAAVPSYQVHLSSFEAHRKMNKAERIAFCAWMQPFAEKYR